MSKILRNTILISLASLTVLLKIDASLFLQQLIKLSTSLIAVYIISKVFPQTWFSFSKGIYIFSLVLLSINLLSFGSIKRWVSIWGIVIQFSEFSKITMLLMLSSFLAEKELTPINLIKALTIVLAPTLLIFKQPNLGTAIILSSTGFILIWMKGVDKKILIGSISSLLASLPIIWKKMLPYQKARITAFLDKGANAQGSSYQTIQSIIAIGSGGFFGSQALHNRLGFVPENHTDFLFSYFGERYGFFWTSIIILLIIFSLFKILQLSSQLNDSKQKFFCIGFAILWFIQSFMNIGMNIGILPVTGVALPFFSYGGSSLLAFFIGIGIIVSFAKYSQIKE